MLRERAVPKSFPLSKSPARYQQILSPFYLFTGMWVPISSRNPQGQQMEILTELLREPECGGRIIAGDFNTLSPEDDVLLNKNKLTMTDVRVAFHGKAGPGGVSGWCGGTDCGRAD